jgi:hypothetical protein
MAIATRARFGANLRLNSPRQYLNPICRGRCNGLLIIRSNTQVNGLRSMAADSLPTARITMKWRKRLQRMEPICRSSPSSNQNRNALLLGYDQCYINSHSTLLTVIPTTIAGSLSQSYYSTANCQHQQLPKWIAGLNFAYSVMRLRSDLGSQLKAATSLAPIIYDVNVRSVIPLIFRSLHRHALKEGPESARQHLAIGCDARRVHSGDQFFQTS